MKEEERERKRETIRARIEAMKKKERWCWKQNVASMHARRACRRAGVVRRTQRSFNLQQQTLSRLCHCLCPSSTCNTCIYLLDSKCWFSFLYKNTKFTQSLKLAWNSVGQSIQESILKEVQEQYIKLTWKGEEILIENTEKGIVDDKSLSLITLTPSHLKITLDSW